MPTTDERVLKFIGRDGTTEGDLDQHFPSFDVNRLIRAQLVAIATEQDADTEAHGNDRARRYFLTPRGIEAAGIENEGAEFFGEKADRRRA
jgi:hypothetical protein